MNKSELVSSVAEKAELSKKDAEKAVAAVIASVTEALKAGDKVQLVGFGTFEVRERAARTGHNPKTNTESAINIDFFVPMRSDKLPNAGVAINDAT